MKLIIYITGKPIIHGYKRRDFRWVPKHNCYLYQEKEFLPSEFNAACEKIMRDNQDMYPLVRVIEVSDSSENWEAAPPVTTITTAREITVAEAEAVMEHLAPHRLKKKPGPKTAAA